ncbi:CopG family transcriptional regulator [Cellulomonas sp. GbtcB1]|jgi:hypothetical protein|uniref:ribbon-helix-helix domain-containing protein n=1 Tax=unclassified Cellulomonas TaxID=2620175 RepID=UPI001C2F87C3|nr:CopG family transcriptional regulator [Cellulomonas sp. GbtcB1]
MTEHDEARAAMFAADPAAWGEPREVLTGADASAFGRSVLEAAGVDVGAVERSVGRPRVGGGQGRRGVRSPRVNVTISAAQEAAIERLEQQGLTRSQIVRDALDRYLAAG